MIWALLNELWFNRVKIVAAGFFIVGAMGSTVLFLLPLIAFHYFTEWNHRNKK